ncbi:MAG TPA: hypothetical protein DCY79_18365 [Planctomycetaceae bacterium]|nr:hypothetical protein [Blastopirellula sp.]HAY81773.1 hypothetical protein [Planctomycetaceae bacterium]
MSKWNLPRRTFLRGAGVAMGLPLLQAMTPTVRAAEVSHPNRMAFIFFPNGAIMPSWTPQGEGRDYQLSETLSALQDFKNDMNVITGLAQDMGRAHGDGAGDHARCASTYLTGAHPVKTSGENIKVGMSVDQVAAEEIGERTKLPSMELGIERGRNAGNCDSGYSCAYSTNVSWKTATTPMAKEVNPRLVFERLFGNGEPASEATKRRQFYRKSILDMLATDAARLKKQLGKTDQRKMDEYFTSVRELEQRIERNEKLATTERPELDLPRSAPAELADHIRLMYDLQVLAFQTDTTRISTFMLGNAGSNRAYKMVNVSEGHHQLSHHRNKEDMMTKIQRIDRFLADQFAYFLQKLRDVREGEGTLLDHCMVMYGSGLSDANRHAHDNLPIVLAGRGCGTITPGQHVVMSSETPLNNLFLSLLDRMDAKVDKLGDSSGRLTALDA